MNFCNLSKTGKLKPDRNTNEKIKPQISKRILRFKNDEYDRFGILILTDDKEGTPPGSEYMECMDCRLFTFPFTPVLDSHVVLSTIKEGIVHKLMTSDESEALAEDSYFRTMQANKEMFHSKGEEFELQKDNKVDEVKDAYAGKENLYALVLTSDSNCKSMIYAIKNIKDPNSMNVSEVKMFKDEVNVRKVEFDLKEDDDPPIHSFYIHSHDFGDDVDSLIQVSN